MLKKYVVWFKEYLHRFQVYFIYLNFSQSQEANSTITKCLRIDFQIFSPIFTWFCDCSTMKVVLLTYRMIVL